MGFSRAQVMIPKFIQLKTQLKIGLFEIFLYLQFLQSYCPIWQPFIEPLFYEEILLELVKDINMSKP